MKEIETLLDIKNLLKDISNEDLEEFGIGTNDEGDGEITIITEKFYEDKAEKIFEKLQPLSDYLKKILEAHKKNIEDEDYTTEGLI